MKKIALLWIVILCVVLCTRGQLFAQNFDIDALKSTNINRNQRLDASFRLLSDATLPLIVATPLLVTGIGLLRKDSTTIRKGVYIGVSLASTIGATLVMKYAIDRPRPYVTYPFLDNQKTETDPSFPSGHTSSSFALATSLSLAYPKWYVVVPSYTYATLTAYSRLHLGVHYPSDVLTGALIGSGCAWLSHYLNKKIKWKRR